MKKPMTKDEIKELRKVLNLTQMEFARLVGTSFGTVNRWENGKSIPRGLSITALEEIKSQLQRKKKSSGVGRELQE